MSNFTLKHYTKTIENYLRLDYKFSTANNSFNSHKKQIYLAHDIDMDTSLVSKMSLAEDLAGVKSTYYFRVRSRNYNILSQENIFLMQSLVDRGHGVGLHYEPRPGFVSKELDYENDICKLLEFLSYSTDLNFNIFNIHEPSRTGIDLSKILVEKNRCYNSPFFEGFKYLSDSGARWREGCFSEHLGKWEKMLVLTHPFWWYDKSPGENY